MNELAAELTGYQSAVILTVTWALIEMMTPVAEWIVKLPDVRRHRLVLYELQLAGKRIAAVLWCSLLVWFPHAQPPLCPGADAPGCQTTFNRIAIGIILGILLSLGHWGGAILFRRLRGVEKPDKRRELTESGLIQKESPESPSDAPDEKTPDE